MGLRHSGDGRPDRGLPPRGGRVVAVGTTSVRLLETAAAEGTLKPFDGYTDLFIRPPYQFHTVDALLTNFHLPRTTLLVLVRTFGGDELIRRAYEEAIREQYRFYSYGDAMLITIDGVNSHSIFRKDTPVSETQLERVLVIPTELFRRLGYFQGFSGEVSRYLGRTAPAGKHQLSAAGPKWRRTPASNN